MEIVNRELRKHMLMVADAKKHIFKNPKHLTGMDSYKDKRKVSQLEEKIRNGKLMKIEDLQFLETIYEKY